MARLSSLKIGDKPVKRIGLGTNRISDNDESRSVLKEAVRLGLDYIDTADKYGQSEDIIGETLAPYPPNLVIGTKGGWTEDNSPDFLLERINNSLRRLKLESIELWQLHRAASNTPIEDTMRFLKEQMTAGKIKNIGLSEVSAAQIEAARKIVPIASVQNRYNLYDRSHDQVVDYCERQNIIFMPFFPLASGRMSQDAGLREIAGKYNAAPTQIALAWLLKRSPVMLPIPGTLSAEHLRSNMAAGAIDLSDKDFEYLKNT